MKDVSKDSSDYMSEELILDDFHLSVITAVTGVVSNNRRWGRAGHLRPDEGHHFSYKTNNRDVSPPALNIILPVMNREQHLLATIKALVRSLNEVPGEKRSMVTITVAELGTEKKNFETAKTFADYYLFVEESVFNKSYLMNKAAEIFQAETYLFHDVDLLVESGFISSIVQTITDLYANYDSNWVYQPVPDRKIFYVDEATTAQVFADNIAAKDLKTPPYAQSLSVQPTWFEGNYPPGGSIVISRQLFHAVQGYDPTLYWGYSPEDKALLLSIQALGAKFFYPQHRGGESPLVYHLFHENSGTSNDAYEHMVLVDKLLIASPALRATHMLNKHIQGAWNSPTREKWIEVLPEGKLPNLMNLIELTFMESDEYPYDSVWSETQRRMVRDKGSPATIELAKTIHKYYYLNPKNQPTNASEHQQIDLRIREKFRG